MHFRVSYMVEYRHSGICQPISWVVRASSGDDAIDRGMIRTFDALDYKRAIKAIHLTHIQRWDNKS